MGATRADAGELLKSRFFIPFAKTNGATEPLLFCGWSLNYEMFFYLALTGGLLISRRKAAWMDSGLVLATMLVCMPLAGQSVVAKFYSNTMSIEFLLGILCYYLCRAISTQTAEKQRVPALISCCVCSLAMIAAEGFFPKFVIGPPRLLTLAIPAFLLVTSASLLSQSGWDTKLGLPVLIGDASYILYLVHPYSEDGLSRVLGRRFHFLTSESVTGPIIAIIFSVLLAILIHVYAERPTVRFLNRRFGGARKSVEFSTSSPVSGSEVTTPAQ
jgi:exopolysaccharide production protein ExoZ